MTFTDAGLPPARVAAQAKDDITEPMPIQTLAMPVLLADEASGKRRQP